MAVIYDEYEAPDLGADRWTRIRFIAQRLNPFRKKSGILNVIRAQAKRNRVVSKHGHINTFNRPEEALEQHRYLKDIFTSAIDLPWSWTLFAFATSFFISWLFFAVIWYLVVLVHGDLSSDFLDNGNPFNHTACVDNINGFTSCFLFSLETQHTIGYGGRATTEQCPVAIIVMSIQSIVGIIIQACMAGIVFAKFTKPTYRAETIMFSKNALITLRNGSLYLVCRIGDMRQRHLLESHVSGHMIHKITTEENEVIPYHMEQMEFGSELDGSNDFVQLFWPICISHKIDEDSPLWEMSPRDVLAASFEIIVTMEGTTPETGNSIQVRTSYLPNEILWGYRFDHTSVAYDKQVAKYAVSYSTVNKCTADRTPRCSSKDWEERKLRRTSSSLNDVQG